MFGSGKYSLQKIDSAGNTDLWVGYLQDLAGRPATNSHASGIFDVFGTFEKADGSGSFQLGIRLSPNVNGSYDLVTILTKG